MCHYFEVVRLYVSSVLIIMLLITGGGWGICNIHYQTSTTGHHLIYLHVRGHNSWQIKVM